jgi:hypothetical protein
MDTLPNTLDGDMIRAARELWAIVRSVCLVPRSPITVRPVAAVRVIVRRVVVRLHAARSAIEDAAALAICTLYTSPVGTAVSGFRAFRASFKNFQRERP